MVFLHASWIAYMLNDLLHNSQGMQKQNAHLCVPSMFSEKWRYIKMLYRIQKHGREMQETCSMFSRFQTAVPLDLFLQKQGVMVHFTFLHQIATDLGCVHVRSLLPAAEVVAKVWRVCDSSRQGEPPPYRTPPDQADPPWTGRTLPDLGTGPGRLDHQQGELDQAWHPPTPGPGRPSEKQTPEFSAGTHLANIRSEILTGKVSRLHMQQCCHR